MKRKVIAMIISGACACSMFSVPALAAENLFGTNPEKSIILNEDCTDFAYSRRYAGISIDNLTAWADQYVDTNVGTIILNTQAYRSNYGGNVMEAIWEHMDRSTWGTSMAEAMYIANKKGLDLNGVRVDLLRERSISPWVSIRMNDIHDATSGTAAGTTSTFKGAHSFNIGSKSTGQESYCLDYNLPQVRNYYFSVIREDIERYDVDGIELDWQRECYRIFDDAYREETRLAINDMIRDIRKLLDFWEIERGHEIYLAVRVPATLAAAEGAALDAKTWSAEKLVDVVTVAPRWASLDTDMDMEDWIQMLKVEANNPDIQVGAGLDVLYRAYPGDTGAYESIETARGASYSYLSRGADYMYLFNHMDGATKMMYADTDYIPTLNQINALENMQGKIRRQAVTFHDKWGVDEEAVYALPAISSTSAAPSFDIHMGNISTIKDTENYYVILGAHQNYGGEGIGIIDAAEDCTVSVNGTACEYVGSANDLREPTPVVDGLKIDLTKYSVPASAMQDGYNTVSVACADGTERQLRWVEIYTEPKTE